MLARLDAPLIIPDANSDTLETMLSTCCPSVPLILVEASLVPRPHMREMASVAVLVIEDAALAVWLISVFEVLRAASTRLPATSAVDFAIVWAAPFAA